MSKKGQTFKKYSKKFDVRRKSKKTIREAVLFLAENLKIHESASIANARSNVKRANPKPL